jgi:hypothetical protein
MESSRGKTDDDDDDSQHLGNGSVKKGWRERKGVKGRSFCASLGRMIARGLWLFEGEEVVRPSFHWRDDDYRVTST